MGATDQPRYNGFRNIRVRVIMAFQCIGMCLWTFAYGRDIYLLRFLWTCTCGHLPIDMCLWTCACGYLPVDMCLWTCSCRHLPVDMCFGHIPMDIYLWTCALDIYLWTFTGEHVPRETFQSAFLHSIMKTRLFKYIENFTTKNWNFTDKISNIFFIFLLKT